MESLVVGPHGLTNTSAQFTAASEIPKEPVE